MNNLCLSRPILNNVRTLSGNEIVEIGRAADALAGFVQDVSIHHRCPNVTATKEFLHHSDVVAGFNQVGGEAVPERVARGPRRVHDRISPVPGGDVKQILEGNCERRVGRVEPSEPPELGRWQI